MKMIVEDPVRDGWITERTLNDIKDYFQSRMTEEVTNQLIGVPYSLFYQSCVKTVQSAY